jgi:hypothetical protein
MITLTFKVLLANINHSMTRAQKRADIAKFGRMFSESYIAGGCEIDNPDSREFWGEIGVQHLGGATETPAILSADWAVREHKVLPRTIGTAGFDPPRETLLLRLRHVPTGIKVSHLVTHMDHQAFNGPVLGRLARRAKWMGHLAKDRHLIWRLRAAGELVVHEGDLNNGRAVVYGRRQQTLHPVPGVMQIAVLPPLRRGWRVRLGRRVVDRQVHTDHPLMSVSVNVTKG